MSSLTLSKEQVAVLLPLLPTIAETLAGNSTNLTLPTSSVSSFDAPENTTTETLYTNGEMFSRKKNTHSTAAQNHLLYVKLSKAATIWNNPPLMKDLTPIETKKFYDTAFLLCPQLKSARHLLTTRLSRSLINRRQFLRRSRKIPMRLSPRPVSSDTLSKSWNNDDTVSSPAEKTPDGYEVAASPFTAGEPVRILKEETFIAKGIFLKMNTEASHELFAKVLFRSFTRGTRSKDAGLRLDLELPEATDRGKTNFNELEDYMKDLRKYHYH